MTGLEVLNNELSLANQWQLGAGGRVIWAPPKPRLLDQPGFRDPGTFDGFPIEPIFAITLLDQRGRLIATDAAERKWTPAQLELKYRLPQALITERRTVLATETLLSEWTMSHAFPNAQHYWLVLWTRRPHQCQQRRITEIEANPQGISFQEAVCGPDGRELARWGCALGASFDADSWSVNTTPVVSDGLSWEESPFYELMTPGGLPGHVPANENLSGDIYCALAYPFEIPAGERLVVSFAASFGCDVEHARRNLERSVAMIHPIQACEEDWINWFEDVPCFTCSDPFLQRLYWYRWAQRRLYSFCPSSMEESEFVVSKGCDNGSRTVAAQVSGVIEAAWQHSGDFAWEELRMLLNRSTEELAPEPVAQAISRLDSIHPDPEMRRGVRLRLNELAHASLRSDNRSLGWHEETAFTPTLRESLMHLQVLKLLASRGPVTNGRDWSPAIESLVQDIYRQFWDESVGFFVQPIHGDIDRRPAKTLDAFLALSTLPLSPEQRQSLWNVLFDPEYFWTNYPLPTLSRDDPDFSAEGHWQSHRCPSPRNGRVWLHDCSMVIDAVGARIEHASATERAIFAELVRKVMRLTFPDDQVEQPAFHQHYNPLNGKPSAFLGRDHQGAGWFIDHILRYVAGIRPTDDGSLIIDPLPFNLEWFTVRNVVIGDHELDIEWDQRTGLTVRVDEEPAGRASIGQSLCIALPEPWPVG